MILLSRRRKKWCAPTKNKNDSWKKARKRHAKRTHTVICALLICLIFFFCFGRWISEKSPSSQLLFDQRKAIIYFTLGTFIIFLFSFIPTFHSCLSIFQVSLGSSLFALYFVLFDLLSQNYYNFEMSWLHIDFVKKSLIKQIDKQWRRWNDVKCVDLFQNGLVKNSRMSPQNHRRHPSTCMCNSSKLMLRNDFFFSNLFELGLCLQMKWYYLPIDETMSICALKLLHQSKIMITLK